MNYWIVADICSDLPKTYVYAQERLTLMPMNYTMAGKEYSYRVGDENRSDEFYQKIRGGEKASTSLIGISEYYDVFKQITDSGEGVLCVPLSSGISGSFGSALSAREQILAQKPEAKVQVVDSLAASLGLGLLIDHVLKNRARGMSLEENARWIIENRLKVHHWFTVDDLNHLYRGGRLSRSSALIGSMLRIKPVLHVNREGRLVAFEKVQGRKRSLKALADMALEHLSPQYGRGCFISHADAPEDAEYVAGLIKDRIPAVGEIFISPIGAVVGAHAGPGTVALFFMGEER